MNKTVSCERCLQKQSANYENILNVGDELALKLFKTRIWVYWYTKLLTQGLQQIGVRDAVNQNEGSKYFEIESKLNILLSIV